MASTKKMSDDDLRKFLDSEEKDALGYSWGTLQTERAAAMDYYFARPFGNELEGRSDVVSTQVFDTVEWVLPQLIRIFASTDKAVEFEPQGEEDIDGAKQATETCNYVFYRQNPGFLVLYSWFKDALVQKNGIVKWYWAKKSQKARKKFTGITLEMVTMLLEKEGAEIVSKQEYPDPVIGHMIQTKAMEMQLSGQPMPPQMPQPPMIYDVEVEFTQEAGKVCIAPVPPEEFIVSRRHNSMILDEAPFCAHVRRVTLSELRGMGYEFEDDDEDLTKDAQTWQDWSAEKVARTSHNEDGDFGELSAPSESTDPSQKMVWCREIYCQVDVDGDGIAEKRRIVRAGNKVFENDICEHVQMAAITPIIITHRFFGMSWAEMVMDLQFLCSTIWRQMLDNLFHANNQSHIVLSTPDGRVQANIDDLLNPRPGRVMREYMPNAIRHEETPWVAAQSFPMLEYIDQQRMNRSGTNYLSSGLSSDSINKTARGAVMAQNMMQEKVELVARIFAEGFKELFKGVRYMLSKYQDRPMTFRLLNNFVSYDPTDWKTQFDTTINVGLGTGNKDQQLVHLTQISQDQIALLSSPLGGMMVTPKNVYNVRAKIAENAGFKNVSEFYTEPKEQQIQPPAPPPPDPVKMGELQLKAKDTQIKAFEAQTHRMSAMASAQKSSIDAQQGALQAQHSREMDVRNHGMEIQRFHAEQKPGTEMEAMRGESAQSMQVIGNALQQLAQQQADGFNAILQALQGLATQRRQRIPTRDPKTREILHVDDVPVQESVI